ncbi:hypothetical protein LX69_01078 [Breznakibacter xylanolyticus]|uniref:Uncharacterized protein n=1 Tax=Breznakibacter xylanolyticus TaxID=990 RepID=A0A2W7NEX2_9BACT|nr:hypothetical protein LX69_01078 [Breznakibacter xylanolyticus]
MIFASPLEYGEYVIGCINEQDCQFRTLYKIQRQCRSANLTRLKYCKIFENSVRLGQGNKENRSKTILHLIINRIVESLLNLSKQHDPFTRPQNIFLKHRLRLC